MLSADYVCRQYRKLPEQNHKAIVCYIVCGRKGAKIGAKYKDAMQKSSKLYYGGSIMCFLSDPGFRAQSTCDGSSSGISYVISIRRL